MTSNTGHTDVTATADRAIADALQHLHLAMDAIVAAREAVDRVRRSAPLRAFRRMA